MRIEAAKTEMKGSIVYLQGSSLDVSYQTMNRAHV